MHNECKKDVQKEKRIIVDFVGILQEMRENSTRAGKPFVTMTMIDTSNNNVSIRLWEEIVTCSTRFPRVAIEASCQPTILGLKAMRVTDYMGKLQLQSTNATHIYLYPTTPETHTLLNLYEKLASEKENLPTGTHNRNETPTKPQQNLTISEILTKNSHELIGQTVTVNAAITNIAKNKEWHCIGCLDCDQSLIKAGKAWFCSDHGNYD